MKRYLVLAAIALSACESPVELAARQQIDAACLAGDLQACAAVQERRAGEDLSLATSLISLN